MDFSASTALQHALPVEVVRPSFDTANDNIEVLSHDLVTWHNVDHRIDAVSFVERMLGDAVIAKQSEMVAHKLAAAGFDPYLKSDDTVSMVGLISGAVIGLSKYRNLNIIPEVAQRNRLGLVNEFKLFLDENPKIKKYARYTVVTSGPRFPIAEFPDRLKVFNERLGRYLELCKKASIECVLIAIEFTVDDDQTVNLHANVVTSPRKAFGPTGWTEWLAKTRSHFGGKMVHDAGRVRDPNEIIKYVTKYGDIAELGGADTALIAQTLYKKQMIRPLGLFKRWRKTLHDNGQKVRFDHVRKSLVRCQTSKRKKPVGEDWTDEEVMEDIIASNDRAERERMLEAARRAGRVRTQEGSSEPVENQILCRTLPQNRATLLAEPFVVVVNFNGDPSTRNGREGLEAIEARRRHHFKLLAEQGVEAEDVRREASILDTLTIIPNSFGQSYFRISEKRREKLRKSLGLMHLVPSPDSYDSVELAVREVLDRHLPQMRHEWSLDVACVETLLLDGLERQETWLSFDAAARAAGEAFDDFEVGSAYACLSDADLDDVIPY